VSAKDKSTEELLLDAAIDVFAKHGYAGATVKAISEQAGVNISLVSYHYQGKEGLYRSCLERFGKERLEIARKILTSPQNRDDFLAKMRLWIEQFLDCHLENPQMVTIINREMMADLNLVKDIFASTFLLAFHALVEFCEAAKKKGLVKKNIDCEVFSAAIYGAVCHVGRTENIQMEFFTKNVRDEKYRNNLIEQLLLIVSNGVLHETNK
jgi:AcrR family transcriptional regulator